MAINPGNSWLFDKLIAFYTAKIGKMETLFDEGDKTVTEADIGGTLRPNDRIRVFEELGTGENVYDTTYALLSDRIFGSAEFTQRFPKHTFFGSLTVRGTAQ